MDRFARAPMLVRLAGRYARRHRGQTTRAVLGLIVVALVLTVGVGLGDSVESSFEESVRAQYGPVDVILRSPTAFNASIAEIVPTLQGVAGYGVVGGPTIVVSASVSDLSSRRAEASATVRGVGPREDEELGPLPGGAPDPGPGQVVLAQSLAERLGARLGDDLLLRAQTPGANETLGLKTKVQAGNLGAPGPGSNVSFSVEPAALGFYAFVRWEAMGGPANVTAVGPSGQTHTNTSRLPPAQILIEEGLEPGNWTLRVEGALPVPFEATITVGYPPPSLNGTISAFQARVSAIVPDEGRAAVSSRPVALVPLADLQAALNMTGKATNGYYHVATDAVGAADAIDAALHNRTLDADAAQDHALEHTRELATDLTGFLIVMSGFTLVASVLLAYALFSSLVEERRAELGIARALGFTRLQVAGSMIIEASLYAVLAALAGLLLGILVVWGLLETMEALSFGRRGAPLLLHFEPWSLPTAFLGGVLLPVVTIAIGTFRFARLDPARAIRGAPEDVRLRRTAALAGGALVLLLGLALVLDPIWRLVGAGIAAAGGALILHALGRRLLAVAALLAGCAYTIWSLYTFTAWPPGRRELEPIFNMARGLVITLLLCGVVFASRRPFQVVGQALQRIRGLGRAAFVGVRYLTGRRVTAGLTAAMVAVVALVITVVATLAIAFAGSLKTDEAGYEVLGQGAFPMTSFPAPLAPEDNASIERVDFMVFHRALRPLSAVVDGSETEVRRGVLRTFVGVTPGFAEANEYILEARAARYASDREAWDAVARGEALLAPAWYFDPGELHLGSTIEIKTFTGTSRTYIVAGGIHEPLRSALFIAQDHVRALGFPQTTIVFVRAAPGADPDALAHRLTDAYDDHGLVFESIPEEARQASIIIQQTILVLEGFLALGVLVGIAATSFLAARAVKERIRDIGTLRALGYEPNQVGRAFLLESVVVCAIGAILGTTAGLIVSHSVWWHELRPDQIPFSAPTLILSLYVAFVLVLGGLAARGPSRRAAAIDPAVSLRHVE